jgi:hypothetical protein
MTTKRLKRIALSHSFSNVFGKTRQSPRLSWSFLWLPLAHLLCAQWRFGFTGMTLTIARKR